MIVDMLKVHVVSQSKDRDLLLGGLRKLGVVHLVPVEVSKAVADDKTVSQLRSLNRAIQILSAIKAEGQSPELDAVEAAKRVLDIQQQNQERQTRLTSLYRQLEQVEKTWGDLDLAQLDRLREADIDVKFYSVSSDEVDSIQAELAHVVSVLKNNRSMVAVVNRGGDPKLPESAKEIALPSADAAGIRREAGEIDEQIKADAKSLTAIANLLPVMKTAVVELEEKSKYAIALGGGASSEHLFAVQGWIPKSASETFVDDLTSGGVIAAVEFTAPDENEEPPTLIVPPNWAKPISGLFSILGTVSGYKEFDVSIPFMVALPIFAAMLISDGGYGLLLLLGLTLSYKKASKALGVEFTKLMIVISAAALGWGLLSASFFGFTLYSPLIPVDTTEKSRFLLMNISFILGAIHLCFAHVWNGIRLFPSLRFLCEAGWSLFIIGMLGVVRMFVLNAPFGWDTVWPYLLIPGAALAIIFHYPSSNVFKMVGIGFGTFAQSMLSAFSDIISYVRLMAVGLASTVLATSFNNLALESDFIVLTVAIMIFGHSLNIGLALIALFAHGVRLNMLEFSNNLGMQWTGYSYEPFARCAVQED